MDVLMSRRAGTRVSDAAANRQNCGRMPLPRESAKQKKAGPSQDRLSPFSSCCVLILLLLLSLQPLQQGRPLTGR
jgi:hypothetical protein